MKQTITRKGSFDAGHRVMHERVKCFNVHGHLYQYELTFEYSQNEDIGYAIDFKEIKRIACEFIDEYFDHGFITNAHDNVMISACQSVESKMWIMSLNGVDKFCNPTAENISKELFLIVDRLMHDYKPNLELKSIRLYETPNCFVDCTLDSLTYNEILNFYNANQNTIDEYRIAKGKVEYDDRKI